MEYMGVAFNPCPLCGKEITAKERGDVVNIGCKACSINTMMGRNKDQVQRWADEFNSEMFKQKVWHLWSLIPDDAKQEIISRRKAK